MGFRHVRLVYCCHFDGFSISPYSVRMRENMDQNNSKYGHFSHRGTLLKKIIAHC